MAKAAEVVLQLTARNAQYLAKLRESTAAYTRSMMSIRQAAGASNAYLRSTFAVLAGGAGLAGAQRLVDASTRITNALKVAGLSGTELSGVYDRLFASAQRNAAPLESLVTLYGRAAIVQKELGVSTDELLGFTDNVAMALRVAGTDAQTASGALLQLSQALGSGVVRAEEFNSMLEGALPIVQAAAAGLEEAGGSVSKLRQLVVDGKVSSSAFFRAFEAGASMLEEKLAGAELTVSQAFVRLQNVLIDTAGELNTSSGATKRMAEALELLGQWIRDTDFSPLINGVMDFGSAIAGVIGKIQEMAREAGKAVGADKVGDLLRGSPDPTSSRPQTFEDVRNAALGLTTGKGDRVTPGDAATQRVAAAFKRPVKPKVALDDHPILGDGKKKAGSKENPYDRESRQILERTAAIQAETAALAGINPLINDYGFAVEKARATQELLTAAKRQGLAITPELEQSIEQLAERYANASVEAEKLAESQNQVRQTAEEMRALGKEVLGSFISDIRSGTSAADALASALGRVADRLLDMALTNLFSPSGGLGGGGLLGGRIIPGILHDGGVAGLDGYGHGRSVPASVFAGARRYHTGTNSAGGPALRAGEIPAILQRGEVVIPKDAIRGGQPQPQQVHVTVGVSADSAGNLRPFVESVSAQTSGAIVQRATPGIVGASTNAVGQRLSRQPRYLRG
jgi:tape measure domain-containing protein